MLSGVFRSGGNSARGRWSQSFNVKPGAVAQRYRVLSSYARGSQDNQKPDKSSIIKSSPGVALLDLEHSLKVKQTNNNGGYCVPQSYWEVVDPFETRPDGRCSAHCWCILEEDIGAASLLFPL